MRAIILAAVLMTAFLLPAMGEKADLKLLPQDIDIVFSVNLKPAEKAEGFENYVKPALAEIEAFQKATGINLKDDAVSVTLATKEHVLEKAAEEGGKDKTETRSYTVIKGKFDVALILQTLNNPPPAPEGGPAPVKVTTEEYLRASIHSLDKNKLSFCFIDKYTLAAGKLDCIKEIVEIDSRKAKAASANTQILTLIPPVIQTSIIWGFFLKGDEPPAEEAAPLGADRGINMQARGRRPRGGGIPRRPGDEDDNLAGLMGLAQELTGFEALGMEASTIAQLKQGAKLTEYVIFNIWLQFEDTNEANKLAQNIKQAQNLMRAAESNPTGRAGFLSQIPQADMLTKMDVTTSGKIVKIVFKYEKEEFAKAQGQFENMFLNGFKQGLAGGRGAAGAEAEKVEDVGEGFEF